MFFLPDLAVSQLQLLLEKVDLAVIAHASRQFYYNVLCVRLILKMVQELELVQNAAAAEH